MDKEAEHKAQAESDYIKFLRKYLGKDPDALLWTLSYSAYVHNIDDIIDGDRTDKEFILRTFEHAAVIYSSDFYLRNIHLLYSLVVMASNTYMDSVILEFSTEKEKPLWKSRTQDYLRHMGNELILMVIQIVGGVEARRKASLELREISWRNHHTTKGEPV